MLSNFLYNSNNHWLKSLIVDKNLIKDKYIRENMGFEQTNGTFEKIEKSLLLSQLFMHKAVEKMLVLTG